MAEEPLAIARIGLARSLRHILLIPGILVVLAAAAIVAGFILPEAAALAIWVVAGVLIGGAAWLAVVPLTLRLEVEVGGLRVRWLLGGRRYRLVPGAVTRAGTAGGHSVIRTRRGFLGWAYGRATLRDEEPISIVRLAPTPSVILVPTDHGRLAIAARSEPELVEGLAAAARVQQRLDEVGGRLAALPPEHAEAAVPAAPDQDEEEQPAPRLLTGIERARLEAELAAARQAALEAAEAERAAMAAAREAVASVPQAVASVAPVPELVAEDVEPPVTAASAARRRVRGTWMRPGWAQPATLRALTTLGWGLVPLVASVGVYLSMGGQPLAGTDPATRLELLGLVGCGPLAALGVIAARRWWPRLAGLVAVTSLLALVILVRGATG